MKKLIASIVLMMSLCSSVSATEISGRPDTRPLDPQFIVSTVRGFVKGGHAGIDFACCVNSKVRATGSGRIICSRYVDGYGNCIIIKHDWVKNNKAYTAFTVYAHLSEFIKLRGTNVYKGDVIALSGNTGRSDGPHLHYEVRDSNETPIWNGTFQSEKLKEK